MRQTITKITKQKRTKIEAQIRRRLRLISYFLYFYLLSFIYFCHFFFLRAALGTKPPKWDPTYHVKGVLTIPYAEIAEPFEAWYDELTKRSRIDYYDGTVKTYQLSHEGDYGASLKVAPVTTDDEENKITCLQVNGTQDNRVGPQSILPDCREFTLVGTEDCFGYRCDRFVLEQSFGQKVNHYAILVRYVKSPKYPAARQPIPVRYEMKGFNSLLGSHYDHYYLDYNFYEHDNIPDDTFEVDGGKPCVGFPGPGVSHYATFNPMKEFIHPVNTSHIDDEMSRFLFKHGISYSSTAEFHRREKIFMHNLRFIHSKNRAQLGYTLSVNHLADKTEDELKALRGFRSSGVYNGGLPFPYEINANSTANLPDDYDWRLFGAVTPVKDQSVCGSCWSFGTTGAVEGAWFLANGKKGLVRLSQQALVDCSWGYGNNGCDGGEDFRAYAWIKKMGGIPTEESYGGYKGQDGFCHAHDNNVTLTAPVNAWYNVTRGDPVALKVALLKHGPISVAIDASHRTFSFYSNGVYYEQKWFASKAFCH